ncbi:MAG: type II toxin-antitoxin system PemK/MazF family toxin [Lacisediminihabitans sp.]
MRGDVYRLRTPRGAQGNEQTGARYAIVGKEQTQVLVEQTAAVAPGRLGNLVGHVSRTELDDINNALRLALELD